MNRIKIYYMEQITKHRGEILNTGTNKGINSVQKEKLLIWESNAVPVKISAKLLRKFDKLIL